ncbi:uncharacterized protein IL334_003784 [Kwoniella shivajii]|uniref:SURF1-like protein n=1 Tax=Kwoniella shivajii TaxID=564305 RepID=A0ABZ1CYH7_9TREE|nr:hypothetical protein IL334_003784 [Kwoniella shivajii]
MSRPIATFLPTIRRSVFPTLKNNISRQPIRFNTTSTSSATTTSPKYTTKTNYRSNLFKPTTLVLICVPILTGFLGVWQIQRLKWKLDLIDEVDRNLQKRPMLLPDNINLSALPEFAFRRVILRGHFEGPPILLGPQTKDGFPGYHLILPFVRESGSTILVNRGYITTTRATAIREGKQAPPGLSIDGKSDGKQYEIEGMLTRPGEKTVWTPDNNTDTNEWFWKDINGMAQWLGENGREVQPVLVDAIEEPDAAPTMLMNQGIPVGRPPHVELRNQHAQYAAIWLSLSASTTVMLAYVLTRGKGGAKSRRPRI